MPKLLRFSDTFGRRGKIPVGHSVAYERFILAEGGDPYIAGMSPVQWDAERKVRVPRPDQELEDDPIRKAKIPRLRRVRIGERAIAFVESDVDAVVEALAALQGSA